MQVLEPPSPRRAVVLVAHGLNVRPDAMAELYDPLRRAGATIVLLELRGHVPPDPGSDDTWSNVQADDWLRDWLDAVATARSLAVNVPLVFLGYSLGCLVHLRGLQTDDGANFSRQALIAPPLFVRVVPRLVRLLRVFGPGLRVRSLTPARIRARNGTTIAAYESLFRVRRSIVDSADVSRLRVPSLVVLDRRDELVSYRGVTRWIRERRLAPPWQVQLIREGAPAPAGIHHYMIDRPSLGDQGYRDLIATLERFLLPEPLSSA